MVLTANSQAIYRTVHTDTFVENIKDALVFANVCNTKMSKDRLIKGLTYEVETIPEISVASWDGGSLTTSQSITMGKTEIQVARGFQFRYHLPYTDERVINSQDGKKKIKALMKREQYATGNYVDQAIADNIIAQSIHADLNIAMSDGTAFAVDDFTDADGLLVHLMKQLKKTAGTNMTGKPYVIASPNYTAHLIQNANASQTESGRSEELKKGKLIGTRRGFNVYESNNIYEGSGYEYLYFGIEGEGVALIMDADPDTWTNRPDGEAYDEMLGVGLFDFKIYDNKKFGIAKINPAAVIDLTA